MSRLVAVTAVGNDRPGIVASVTKVLYELGCNLEDVTSTILRGHFAMMLTARTPDDVGTAQLAGRLEPVAEDLGLVVTARPVEDVEPQVPAPTHMVSVYGSDRPGIVYHVAERLYSAGVNITDMTSRVIGGPDAPVYAIMLEVEVPEGCDIDGVLQGVRSELDIEVSVHPLEADVL